MVPWSSEKMVILTMNLLRNFLCLMRAFSECHILWQLSWSGAREHTLILIRRSLSGCLVDVGLASDPHRILSDSGGSFYGFLSRVQCPSDQVHYRGDSLKKQESGCKWKDHTLESRAFLAFLMWLLQNRPVMAACKAKALKLLLGMISLAFLAALAGQPSVQVSVNIIGKDGNLINGALNFSSLGLCHGDWANLLQHSPGGCQTWEWLRKNMWLGRCISSDMAQASLDDIFFFLGWLMAHSGAKAKLGQKLAVDIAQQALPLLLLSAGQWMDQLGYMKSAEHLQALPVLRTKAGKLRKMMDPVNRMLLLWKLRKEKVQRRKAAVTHDDLVASETSWARKEALVDCVLHQNALLSFMKGHPKQVALSWDPSNYGGKEILVVMGYSKHLQSGFYALNQWLARMKLSDLDDSLIKTAREKKLERLEGYNEIRGLGKALESIDMHWNDFRVPAGLVLRPLMAHEYRVLRPETGRVWIYNEQTQAAVPEVPLDYYLGDIPALISA